MRINLISINTKYFKISKDNLAMKIKERQKLNKIVKIKENLL